MHTPFHALFRRAMRWRVPAFALSGMLGMGLPGVACAGAALAMAAPAVTTPMATPATWQDPQSIRQAAEQFLRTQSAGLPGKISLSLADPVRRMPACVALEPFLPPGAQLWGVTTVGVRCAGEHPWTLYLRARVAVTATYFVAARQIEPGSTMTQADLVAREGDLASLPRNVITDARQAVGAVALNRINAGLPLRQDLLRAAIAISQGQTVRVVTRGAGFEVSTEGRALSRAGVGDTVQVRTRAGQVLSGTVRTGQDGTPPEVDIPL